MAEKTKKKANLKPPQPVKKVTRPVKNAPRSMLDGDAPELPPEYPVLADVAPQMKIDVVVNRDNMLYVLHDKPFPSYLEWIEFDAATGAMTFITAGGKMQDLGMVIYPPMDKFVMEAKEACVMMIRDKKVRDMGLVPLTVQNRAQIDRGG